MINKLSISNFKNIKSLDITKLNQVTLISGKNNIGKTTIFEAILLLFGSSLAQTLIPRFANRNDTSIVMQFQEAVSGLFSDYDIKNIIKIKSDSNCVVLETKNQDIPFYNQTGGALSSIAPLKINTQALIVDYFYNDASYCKITLAEDPVTSSYTAVGNNYNDMNHIIKPVEVENIILINEFGDLLRIKDIANVDINNVKHFSLVREFNNLRFNNRPYIQEYLIPALKLMDDNIEDVEIGSGKQNDQSQIELIKKRLDQPVTLSSLGHGTKRIFNIILGIINARDGILLIDEIENGIHYSVLDKLWLIIFKLAKKCNCQIIATTHSWEITSYVNNQADNVKESFSFINIAKSKSGELLASSYDYDEFNYAINNNIEIR